MQMHARMGEVLYMAANATDVTGADKYLADSFRRFCRSIELCDDYLRGFYGLKLVSHAHVEGVPASNKTYRQVAGS